MDVALPTYNVDTELIEEAITDRTRAIMFAHTLGNPVDLHRITSLAKKHDLWLVEDCCDALGSQYHERSVGGFGAMATFSFYPAHHITMGEGGAVVTDNIELSHIVESFRDWGRDCHCPPGRDNTCRNRYGFQFGGLPEGYDHKYVYSELGYNLKITDMQAAIGLAQMAKLEWFIQRRKDNLDRSFEGLHDLEDVLVATSGPQRGANPPGSAFLSRLGVVRRNESSWSSS